MNEKLEKEISYKDFIVNIIVTSFNKYIKYDYTMYDAYTTAKLVAKTLVDLKEAKNLTEKKRDGFLGVIKGEYRDDASYLDICFTDDTKFGDEWFVGLGNLYRIRDKSKILTEIEEYKKKLSNEDIVFFNLFSQKLSDSIEFANRGNKDDFYFKELSNITWHLYNEEIQ